MTNKDKERKALSFFFDRNKRNTTSKDVPIDVYNKYKGVAPEELITIWDKLGFGIYENGFLQLINPDDYEFIFEYIDILLKPTIPFAITALGDIILWEGCEGKTVAENEGNRCKIIFINENRGRASTNISYFLGVLMSNQKALIDKELFNSKLYIDIKDKLPKLEYGQCYGYVPALALGGKKSNKNLQIVDAKSYIDMIGQAVGKIIDLEG